MRKKACRRADGRQKRRKTGLSEKPGKILGSASGSGGDNGFTRQPDLSQTGLHSDRLAEHCTPFQSPEYDSITVSIIKSESNIVNLEFFPISACQI